MIWAFYAANGLALLCWALLIVAPTTHLTRRVAASRWPLLILSGYYLANLTHALWWWSPATGLTGFFALPTGLYAGWTHYLVLDLFTGQYVYRTTYRYNGWYIATQLLTLMACPLGVVMFILRHPRHGDDHE